MERKGKWVGKKKGPSGPCAKQNKMLFEKKDNALRKEGSKKGGYKAFDTNFTEGVGASDAGKLIDPANVWGGGGKRPETLAVGKGEPLTFQEKRGPTSRLASKKGGKRACTTKQPELTREKRCATRSPPSKRRGQAHNQWKETFSYIHPGGENSAIRGRESNVENHST